MGTCGSKEIREQRLRNKAIDKQLNVQKQAMKNEVKMLLLGAGEAGKTTILKQMQIIHGSGYSQAERQSYKEIVYSNTIQSMKMILDAMDILKIPLEHTDPNSAHAQTLKSITVHEHSANLPIAVSQAIKALWSDAGIRKCFQLRHQYQLHDSVQHYFDSIDRISQPNYLPDDKDILLSRVKTTGIVETQFTIDKRIFRMFDVGGQRSERKKWIHCFENVTCLIFVVGISEYDQVLIEDESVNRVQEALALFDSICNSKWFNETSIILFLNKIDLFKEKLERVPLNRYFSDYMGNNDYESASQFLLEKFLALNKSPKSKQIYHHFTCATDTAQIKFVMDSVKDIILKRNIKDAGLA